MIDLSRDYPVEICQVFANVIGMSYIGNESMISSSRL